MSKPRSAPGSVGVLLALRERGCGKFEWPKWATARGYRTYSTGRGVWQFLRYKSVHRVGLFVVYDSHGCTLACYFNFQGSSRGLISWPWWDRHEQYKSSLHTSAMCPVPGSSHLGNSVVTMSEGQ